LNTLISKINNNKPTAIYTNKIRKSGRRRKSSKNGKERKTSILCSLTGPPKGIQEWQVDEESL